MAENRLAPKKDNKGWYDDTKNLNYKDSWLQNSVELAALGAIMTGAGTLAVKGDFSGAFRKGQKAFGAMGKGFENYLKRNGSMGTKFGVQVGKRAFFNLRKMPKHTGNEGVEGIREMLGKNMDAIKTDEKTQQRLRDEVTKRFNSEMGRRRTKDSLDGTNTARETNPDELKQYFYEKVHMEELNHRLYGTPEPSAYKSGGKNKPTDNKPLFDKKQIARDMVGTGLTGIAFGAGISGFHALDRMSSNPDNQKKLEDTFDYAGSFLKKEDNKMDKKAGALEFYKGLGGIYKKTPEAIAGGIGFTGVSLGTAKMMNSQKEKKDGEEQTDNTRVIIELGKPKSPLTDVNHTPLGLAALPSVASAILNSNDMEKTAFQPFKALKQFGQDFKGYGKQIDELKAENPADVAAARLRNENVPNLVKQQYGNLISNEHSQGNFTNKLFDSYTAQAKNEIDDTIRDLETQTAKARLKASAGGLALAGGGLAGLAAMKSGRKEEPQNGPA